MVDEEGLSALSLRSLGKRLGVSQAAFYRHFPDKAALLEGIAEQVWRLTFESFLDRVDAGAVDSASTPTREAVETIRARNEDTSPSSWGGSVTTRIASLNRRRGSARVRTKKYRPTPIRRATSKYVYIKPEIVSRVPARSKAGRRVPFIVVPSVDGRS